MTFLKNQRVVLDLCWLQMLSRRMMVAMDPFLQENPYIREWFLPGMVVHTCDPITQKAEAGGCRI